MKLRRSIIPAVLAATVLAGGACAEEATGVSLASREPATAETPTTGTPTTRAPATTDAPTTTAAPTTTEAPTTTTTAAPTTTTAPPPPEDPELANARESARSYLDMMGFSRQGLIDQLSSEYGDQYPVEVATAAVDSLSVDWNAEAVEAAEGYLELQAFSHAGLVDQLSSEYGDQFTREQAEHGATAALG
jgi:host cell surface-exposed lipoprotein